MTRISHREHESLIGQQVEAGTPHTNQTSIILRHPEHVMPAFLLHPTL
ncbi:hypothetical protein MK280_12605 [Myxococcota bacterium]|nr:hypothetical protein [Myxococcota bacterium]